MIYKFHIYTKNFINDDLTYIQAKKTMYEKICHLYFLHKLL